MRRMILLSLAFVMLLSGCGAGNSRSGKNLDFKSVHDTEINRIIFIGDSRKDVEKIFGEENFGGRINVAKYGNDLLTITYNKDDKVVNISLDATTNRYVFKDMALDMKSEDINGRFEPLSPLAGNSFYYKYYDKNGKAADREDYTYFARITFSDEKVSSMAIGKRIEADEMGGGGSLNDNNKLVAQQILETLDDYLAEYLTAKETKKMIDEHMESIDLYDENYQTLGQLELNISLTSISLKYDNPSNAAKYRDELAELINLND